MHSTISTLPKNWSESKIRKNKLLNLFWFLFLHLLLWFDFNTLWISWNNYFILGLLLLFFSLLDIINYLRGQIRLDLFGQRWSDFLRWIKGVLVGAFTRFIWLLNYCYQSRILFKFIRKLFLIVFLRRTLFLI